MPREYTAHFTESKENATLHPVLLRSAHAHAHTDVAPPPTLVFDYIWLGAPGLLFGVALLVAVALFYRQMRKRGRGRFRAAVLSILLFIAGDVLRAKR
jgi:hypothetical protein